MKKLIALLCLASASSAIAGERAVVYSGGSEHGGFGGAMYKYTEMNDEGMDLGCAYGAWLINRRAYIGGSVCDTTTSVGSSGMDYGQFGLMAGLFFKPDSVVHYSAELFIGRGLLHKDIKKDDDWIDESDQLVVVEPTVALAVNLTPYSKLTFGLSYRNVSGVDIDGLSDAKLSGGTASLGIAFGTF